MKLFSKVATRTHCTPYRRLQAVVLVAASLTMSSALISCSPYIGNTIDIRKLPTPPAAAPGPKIGFGKTVAVGPFSDARVVPNNAAPENGFSEAVGDTAGLIEDQLRELLLRQGFTIADSASVRIKGDITRWNTQVRTTAMTEISSHATIAVELVDSSNKPLYSATYVGSRNSETPVASKNDIRTSLSIAAANAVENIVEDQNVYNIIAAAK